MATSTQNAFRKFLKFVLGDQSAPEAPPYKRYVARPGSPLQFMLQNLQRYTLWPKGTTVEDIRLLSNVMSPNISDHDFKARAEALGFAVDAVTSSHGSILIVIKPGIDPDVVREAHDAAVAILAEEALAHAPFGLSTSVLKKEPLILLGKGTDSDGDATGDVIPFELNAFDLSTHLIVIGSSKGTFTGLKDGKPVCA